MILPDMGGKQETLNSKSQTEEETLNALGENWVTAIVHQNVHETGQSKEQVDCCIPSSKNKSWKNKNKIVK